MIKSGRKAFLVVIQTTQASPAYLEESLAEMRELADSAGREVIGSMQAHVPHPSASTFLREGKLNELKIETVKTGAETVIFNLDLTPGQARNIEGFLKIRVMDRNGLILEIFARRAKSSEGKLQVELARLNYILPRLGGLGTVLSRLGGGIGTRGPGETELEWDRRKIRRRIESVKDQLKKVAKHRDLLRAGRRKRNFTSVAIVGYTNAGKSTLFNALTGADAYVEDKLFATLETKTRVQTINGRHDLLFIDTVGFIKQLPHSLIEAFHATLEEVTEADILIHVLDVSHPNAESCRLAVLQVLKEIKASEKPFILALNKTDLLNENEKKRVRETWPEGVLISAKAGAGFEDLMNAVLKKASLEA